MSTCPEIPRENVRVFFLGSNFVLDLLLSKIADFVVKIMGIFGIDLLESSSTGGAQSREDIARPFAKAVADFRNKVRTGIKVI
jgi:hypothetical protein